jgi:hypothetical protein
MSDATVMPLAPCLFCKTAGAVEVLTGSLLNPPMPDPDVVFWIACRTCSLRGPWRPTEVQARTAWNWAVTAHMMGEDDEHTDPLGASAS